jgi:hypothetical protein
VDNVHTSGKSIAMPKGNPNPVLTPESLAQRIQPIGDMPDEPLGEKPLAARVGKSIYESVATLSQCDRINWLRRIITETAQRELMKDDVLSLSKEVEQ